MSHETLDHAPDITEFIAAAAERIANRGRQERHWVGSWQAEYEQSCTVCDDDACELLLDALVAFDAFQAQKRPTRLRRVA